MLHEDPVLRPKKKKRRGGKEDVDERRKKGGREMEKRVGFPHFIPDFP